MHRERFLAAFHSLLGRWVIYQETSRRPEDVVELAGARAALDHARLDVAEARGEWDSSLTGPDRSAKRTSVSDDDISRLRVQQFPS